MDKVRGKAGFKEELSSATESRVQEMFEMVQGEYLRKLRTAQPVTQEFENAVKGR